MSTPAHRTYYSYPEYLTLEASSNTKHEYLAGQIYAMAGGTPEHARLAATVSGLLFAQLRGGRCRAYDSDLRVRVRETGLATYPDVTIVCGPIVRDDEDEHAVVNPTVLVEVLSHSTEDYDRTEQFEHYQRLQSLREYVLVSQTERELEVRTRGPDGAFTSRVVRSGEQATLASIGAILDVDELYDVAAPPMA